MALHRFEFRTELPGARPAEVFAHAASWEGVNHELFPLRMTHPPDVGDLSAVAPDGESHFTSMLLLFGVIPVELHRFALRGLEPGRSFDECSSNLLMSRWCHERRVDPIDGGTRVIDVCSFAPRIALLGPLLLSVYRGIFARRHRRLRRLFRPSPARARNAPEA